MTVVTVVTVLTVVTVVTVFTVVTAVTVVLPRLGEMSEVAAAVTFLASKDASFVNATDLKVTSVHWSPILVPRTQCPSCRWTVVTEP